MTSSILTLACVCVALFVACCVTVVSAHPEQELEIHYNKSCNASTAPFNSYHIHVLYWQSHNFSHQGAIALRNAFNSHFGLNSSEGSSDNCDGWPYPPNPIRLCMYEIDNYPTGPFLTAQYSWFVPTSRFADTVPWIMQNRGNFDIFVHPNSGCELNDHLDWCVWGGNKWELDSDVLSCEYPGCGQHDPSH